MFIRIVSSAAAGIAVTTGLLFLMQYLIASGEEIIIDPHEGSTLDWIALETEERLIVDPPDFERPEPPLIPPRTNPLEPGGGDEIGFKPPGPTPPIPAGGPRFKRLTVGDGPLVNIFKVRPQYPMRAATKDLEGTVLVQFDVTTLGTVANVIVIETSSSIFNKAAIDAAYRFKYKPRIVDGVPYESKGLRNLFRFEMEK
jgi:periplasmic protein TonB